MDTATQVTVNTGITEADISLWSLADYYRIVKLIIGSLGLVGNIFVVVVVFSQTEMWRQLTNIYIINQSIVDAAVALFVILSSVLMKDGLRTQDLTNELYCKLWLSETWLWGFLLTSTCNLLLLTIERYIAVVHPIWHKVNYSRTKVYVTIAVVWVFGQAYNMSYKVPTSGITAQGECLIYSFWPSNTIRRAVGLFTICLYFIFPVTMLIFLYVRMVIVLRRRVSRHAGSVSNHSNLEQARWNIIKTLISVAVAYICCWSLSEIMFLMFNLGYEGLDFNSHLYHMAVVMVFFNCCINPFIYVAKYHQFQDAMKKMFCGNRNRVIRDHTGTSP